MLQNANNTTMTSGIGVLFIILVVVLLFRDGGLGGFGGGGDRYPGMGYNWHGDFPRATEQFSKQVCDAEKQEIIDSARNLYAIEQSTNRSIEVDNANTQRLYDQSARQWEANLQEKLFDAKMDAQTSAILTAQALNSKDVEIATLKSEKYIDMKFDRLTSQVNSDYNSLRDGQMAISCEMPKRPPYYAQGFINCGQPIPQGFNNFNNGCYA